MAKANKKLEKLVNAALEHNEFTEEINARGFTRSRKVSEGQLVDIIVASSAERSHFQEIFARLRWGGLFVYVTQDKADAEKLFKAYDNEKSGFDIEQKIKPLKVGWLFGAKGFYFICRKVELLIPGDTTERFTYTVRLKRCPKSDDAPWGWCVFKRVPSYDNLIWRLSQKFSKVDPNDLRKRAQKLVESVFPTFLTREAAILKILQTNMPEEYRNKVPKCLGVEKDSKGFVKSMTMNWLRNTSTPISQLDFAHQSAKLLTALHEEAKVMHLDLRLDNFVITENGVGFIDFGSAVRVGEKLDESPMLQSLFGEMMKTSQIQRMLGKMIEKGHVTNQAISEVYGKVDKNVDTFYMAVQMNRPGGNPDLAPLIEFDPESEAAGKISALTATVLRPKESVASKYKEAKDILRGVEKIISRLQ